MSDKDKKIVRLAVIRANDNRKCPFQLDIVSACKNAGDAVAKMAPIEVLGDEATEEEKQKVASANKRLLRWHLMAEGTEPKKCIYADQIFNAKEKVNCNYGDTAEGMEQRMVPLTAPFYSNVFSGTGLNNLMSIPWGFAYHTPNVTNLYYGAYSLQGSDKEKLKDLIRLADYILENKMHKNGK